MDEQTAEPVTTSPNPVVTDTPAVEPLQAEAVQAESEPVSPLQTAQTITPSDPITETGTAQIAGSEPLPESKPTAKTPSAEAIAEGPQGSLPFSKTDDRQENLVAPQPQTPTVTQGSAATPNPTPTPVQPVLASMPAQAPVTTPRNLARVFLEKAKAVIQLRKQKKLLKIMTLFEKKKHITNDEVEKLLHVSDATTTRYLSELKKQGRIKQVGKTGHAVTYTKI